MKKILVTSNNPAKVSAVKHSFGLVFPNLHFLLEAKKFSSGVSDQPMSDKETLQGALNRVDQGFQLCPGYDYYVGLEGGIDAINDTYHSFAWVVIRHDQHYGRSRTATFILPAEVCKLIDQGLELGEAMDQVYQQHNSKQKQGAVGILSQGLITRSQLYQPAVILALVPLLKK